MARLRESTPVAHRREIAPEVQRHFGGIRACARALRRAAAYPLRVMSPMANTRSAPPGGRKQNANKMMLGAKRVNKNTVCGPSPQSE
eukprot:4996889-Alexandrium_andersonii.AAC.1